MPAGTIIIADRIVQPKMLSREPLPRSAAVADEPRPGSDGRETPPDGEKSFVLRNTLLR
jgi:hypothetical protein